MVRQGLLTLLVMAIATPSAGFELEGFGDITFANVEPASTDRVGHDPNYLDLGSSGSALDDLREASDDDLELQVVVLPSFHPEYVVGIRNTPEGPVVFRIEPESNLWDSAPRDHIDVLIEFLRAQLGGNNAADDVLPSSSQNAKTSRCERPIDPALAARIRAVWKAMILGAKSYSHGRFGLDGATYEFSMSLAGETLAEAHTWSPPWDTRTGRMVVISQRMEWYCEADSPGRILSELNGTVAALAADLERAREMVPYSRPTSQVRPATRVESGAPS